MSSSRSCFDKLGVAPDSTDLEIKKAYRKLALQIHPDKVPEDQKEEATTAFRELYEAYEEALEHPKFSGLPRPTNTGTSKAHDRNTTSSSRTRDHWRREPTDGEIKKAFQDVCDEMERNFALSQEENWQSCIRKVLDAWPNKEKCWMEATGALLPSKVDRLAKVLKRSNPELGKFLVERNAQWKHDFDEETNRHLCLCVERMNRDWPDQKKHHDLKHWMCVTMWGKELLLSDFDEIASNVESSEAARAIRRWKAERKKEFEKEFLARQKESARKIVEVYPDRTRIRSILQRHLISERQDIYNLLPKHIRKALQSPPSGETESSPVTLLRVQLDGMELAHRPSE